jgi:hypothetical protein
MRELSISDVEIEEQIENSSHNIVTKLILAVHSVTLSKQIDAKQFTLLTKFNEDLSIFVFAGICVVNLG